MSKPVVAVPKAVYRKFWETLQSEERFTSADRMMDRENLDLGRVVIVYDYGVDANAGGSL